MAMKDSSGIVHDDFNWKRSKKPFVRQILVRENAVNGYSELR